MLQQARVRQSETLAPNHLGPPHPLHPYFATLCAKRGYNMATIAVAHRLARITFAMLRDGTDFDIRKLNVEEGPFERTIIRRHARGHAIAAEVASKSADGSRGSTTVERSRRAPAPCGGRPSRPRTDASPPDG